MEAQTPRIACVPNVSEGRNWAVIEALTQAITTVPGVRLLHRDVGYDANRTVFTFAGPPPAVVEAAWALAEATFRHIDMRTHHGAHPRIGALDVLPLVPLDGLTLEELVPWAHALGHRIGAAHAVPVYFYQAAAQHPERRLLSAIRQGGYEGLPAKLADPTWAPDAGPTQFNPRTGACVVGARGFLVAFNVNVTTTDLPTAKAIAARVRTHTGVHNLPALQAIGWWMPQYGCCQVSMNLTDYTQTGLRQAYDAVAHEAQRLGCAVAGSELIGLVPKTALLAVGGADQSEVSDDAERIRYAVNYLGLDALAPFDPQARVFEYAWQAAEPSR